MTMIATRLDLTRAQILAYRRNVWIERSDQDPDVAPALEAAARSLPLALSAARRPIISWNDGL